MIINNINLTLAFFNTLDNVKNTRGSSLEQTFWFPISYPEFGINKLWCLTHSLYDPLQALKKCIQALMLRTKGGLSVYDAE